MRIKKAANRDLPPRMLRRVRNLISGTQLVGYYYDGRDENGKRIEIPLGTDLDVAKMEWAKFDRKAVPKIVRLLGDVFNRYERDVIPGKMPRTQKDNLLSLKQLRAAISEDPIDAITPRFWPSNVTNDLAKYRRTARLPSSLTFTTWRENGALPKKRILQRVYAKTKSDHANFMLDLDMRCGL
jgi:hypothetical protein